MNTTSRNELDPRSMTARRSSGLHVLSVFTGPAGSCRATGPGGASQAVVQRRRHLGGPQRLLGLATSAARRSHVLVHQHEADARPGVHDRLAGVHRARRQHPREALGNDRDALLVDVRQQDRELVAAAPRHQVGLPEPARERPGDRSQDLIARLPRRGRR